MLHCIIEWADQGVLACYHGVFTVFTVRMGNWSSLVVPFSFSFIREEILWAENLLKYMLMFMCT